MRCLRRMPWASFRVVPTGAVTRFSLVITFLMGWSKSSPSIKRMSRLVMMPTRMPSWQMGTPEILNRPMISSASRTRLSGERKKGLTMTPFSERLTRSTWSAWRSMVMFLWMMPMPPSRAMAMAMSDSVTVSMAAVSRGALRRMVLVSWVEKSTWLGRTLDSAGISSTSSNVRPSFTNLSSYFMFSITHTPLCFPGSFLFISDDYNTRRPVLQGPPRLFSAQKISPQARGECVRFAWFFSALSPFSHSPREFQKIH